MTKNMVRIKINHDDMKKKSKTRNVDADMTKITAPIALISRVSSSAPPLVASTFEDFLGDNSSYCSSFFFGLVTCDQTEATKTVPTDISQRKTTA
jgi:hypothetical protein